MPDIFKHPIIIYNPKSGGGKTKILFNKYYEIIKNSIFFKKIDVFESQSKIETINKIIDIHDKKYDLIISIGGDGSISTICNGLMNVNIKKRLPILPLPCGSGNSFLLDFNIRSIFDSIKKYNENNQKIVDIFFVEEINGNFKWYCINVVGLGFISNIADYGEKKFNNFGAFKYFLASIFALKEFKPYITKIKYDNNKKEFNSNKVFFISISNSKFTGGKIMIAPQAKYDDGLMDVVILHDINRFDFLNGFRKVFKGSHINDKGCLYFKTTDIEIYSDPDFFLMPDGELEGRSPIKVKIIPKQIRLVI